MDQSTATAEARQIKHPRHMISRLAHPFLIVAVALLIAGAAFLGDRDVAISVAADAAILKLGAGALLLVLIAVFFEQQMQVWRERRELARHLDQAHDELMRMRDAMMKQSTGKA